MTPGPGGPHHPSIRSPALAVLLGTAIGYLWLGYVAFGPATRRARRLGVLGDY